VVFDTSSLLSAAIMIGSVPHAALELALGSCTLCASEATLAELEDVALRPKFDRYQSRWAREQFTRMLRQHVDLIEVDPALEEVVEPPCRDPKDNKVLALVFVSRAEMLVSSDSDLLALDPWNGVPVLTPSAFLQHLKDPDGDL
jgi:uncharacterized protein